MSRDDSYYRHSIGPYKETKIEYTKEESVREQIKEELIIENARLRSVLEWYAKRENYMECYITGRGPLIPVIMDGGNHARRELNK